MTTPWIIQQPLDMHLHLRQGGMLKQVAASSAATFAGAVIMPNLVPPVTSLAMVRSYQRDIEKAIAPHTFTPLMTLFFRAYTYEELKEAKDEIRAIKLYPDGVTTNSSSGIKRLEDFREVFQAMEVLGIPLLVHGESHGFVMDREREFMVSYQYLAENFPKLTIVMEHITTREAIDVLNRYSNVYATVTLHHLLLTLDDLAGGMLQPHLFCKPILKRPEDRTALQHAVLNGHPKLMFGSDSAPHPVSAKECCGCAAGVFSAPVALAMLADFFDTHQQNHRMQHFVSDIATRLHHLQLPPKRIELIRETWTVPDRIGQVVPFMSGRSLPWCARVLSDS